MKRKLLLVIGLAMGIASVAAPTVRADVLSDLGFQLGGSILTLPPAQVIDPPPQGAAKEPLFNTAAFFCSTGAIPTSTTTFGFVILNTHGPADALGKDSVVSAEVAIKDGIHNATYQIFMEQDPGNCANLTSVGTITTNDQGNGNGHAEVSRISTATNFLVAAVDLAHLSDSRSILTSSAATLD